jgi:hypothetical protein
VDLRARVVGQRTCRDALIPDPTRYASLLGCDEGTLADGGGAVTAADGSFVFTTSIAAPTPLPFHFELDLYYPPTNTDFANTYGDASTAFQPAEVSNTAAGIDTARIVLFGAPPGQCFALRKSKLVVQP